MYEEIEKTLGSVSLMSLEQRGLLPHPRPPAATQLPERQILADRVSGCLTGAAVAGALSLTDAGQLGETPGGVQLMDLAADVHLSAGYSAPSVLSDRLIGLRFPNVGQAIPAAREARLGGTPWFEAGVGSFGNVALTRAISVGLIWAAEGSEVVAMAGLDAAVTHASSLAVNSSVLLATAVAELLTAESPATLDAGWIERLARQASTPELSDALKRAARLVGVSPGRAIRELGAIQEAVPTLALATWIAATYQDPLEAINRAAALPTESAVVATIVGALIGAVHGRSAIPADWTAPMQADRDVVGERIVRHLAGPATTTPADKTEGDAPVDIWFLLDRSGSMEAIADDVVGGFNSFFTTQRAERGEANVTVVQFDSQDPHEVLYDQTPIDKVAGLDRHRFQPRGMTPLYDAASRLLAQAERAGGHPSDQLVVFLTDGFENASCESTREQVLQRVTRLQDQGWTFVFLGANQDSYMAGRSMGMSDGSISNYLADSDGVASAFAGVSRATSEWRRKPRRQRLADRENWWGDTKEAEMAARRAHRSPKSD
jgi:Mg-chelatase subunit ChlD